MCSVYLRGVASIKPGVVSSSEIVLGSLGFPRGDPSGRCPAQTESCVCLGRGGSSLWGEIKGKRFISLCRTCFVANCAGANPGGERRGRVVVVVGKKRGKGWCLGSKSSAGEVGVLAALAGMGCTRAVPASARSL